MTVSFFKWKFKRFILRNWPAWIRNNHINLIRKHEELIRDYIILDAALYSIANMQIFPRPDDTFDCSREELIAIARRAIQYADERCDL